MTPTLRLVLALGALLTLVTPGAGLSNRAADPPARVGTLANLPASGNRRSSNVARRCSFASS